MLFNSFDDDNDEADVSMSKHTTVMKVDQHHCHNDEERRAWYRWWWWWRSFWEHFRDGWYLPWRQWWSPRMSGIYLHHHYLSSSLSQLSLSWSSWKSSFITTLAYYWWYSLKDFLLQTADGTYKLVGIVNWGGGYCGEVFIAST